MDDLDNINWSQLLEGQPLDIYNASLNYARSEAAKHNCSYDVPPLMAECDNNIMNPSLVRDVANVIAGLSLGEGEPSEDRMEIPIFANALEGLTWVLETKNLVAELPSLPLHHIILQYVINRVLVNEPEAAELFEDLSLFEIVLAYPVVERDGVSNLAFDFSHHSGEDRIVVTISDPLLYSLCLGYGAGLYAFNITTRAITILGEHLANAPVSVQIPFSVISTMFQTLGNVAYISGLLLKNTDEMGMTHIPGQHFSIGTYSGMDKNRQVPLSYVNSAERLILVLNPWSGLYQFSLKASYYAEKYVFGFQPNTFLQPYNLISMEGMYHQFSNDMRATGGIKCSGSVAIFPSLTTDYDAVDVTEKLVHKRNEVASLLDGVDRQAYSDIKRALIPHTRGGARVKLQQILEAYLIDPTGKSVRSYGDAPGTWLDYLCSGFRIASYDSISDTKRNDTSHQPFQYHDHVLQKCRTKWRNLVTINDVDLRDYSPTAKVGLLLSDAAFEMGFDFNNQAFAHDDLFSHIIGKIHLELEKNGVFICKMYDMTPRLEAALLDVSQYFKMCEFYKPSNSWADNAERYFVAIGYSPTIIKNPSYNLRVQNASLIAQQIDTLRRVLNDGFGYKLEKLPGSIASSLYVDGDVPCQIRVFLSRFRFQSDIFFDTHSGDLSSYTNSDGDVFVKIRWHAPKFPFVNSYVLEESTFGVQTKGRFLSDPFVFHTGYLATQCEKFSFLYLEPLTAAAYGLAPEPAFISLAPRDLAPSEASYVNLTGFYKILSNVGIEVPVPHSFLSLKQIFNYFDLHAFSGRVNCEIPNFHFAMRQFFRAVALRSTRLEAGSQGVKVTFGFRTKKSSTTGTHVAFGSLVKKISGTAGENFPFDSKTAVSSFLPISVVLQQGWTSLGPKFIEFASGQEMAYKSAGPTVRRFFHVLQRNLG